MKKMRRIGAILTAALAAAMLTLPAMPAMNAAAYDITMSSTTGHTYKTYQIFSGDLHEEGSTKTLSNIAWGAGVNYSALVDALKADSVYGSAFTTAIGATTAADAAEKVATQLATYNSASDVKALAKIIGANTTGTGGALTGLSSGYYLIKDETAPASMPAGNTHSDFMLEVVSNVTVSAKDETVTSDKKVTDTNDSTGASEADQTDADYDIGDDIPYVLTFTLPAKYADYSTYPVTFNDDMCKGLTYKTDSAKIYYGASDTTGTAINLTPVTGTSYTDGQKYQYVIANLKTAAPALGAGDVVRIEYQATLNGDAAVGSAGNENKYNVTFANDPTFTGEGTPPTGETPVVTNVVFTYQLIVNKVHEDPDNPGTYIPLTGANFDLYKYIQSTDNWVKVTELHSGTGAVNPTKTGDTTGSQFVFKGLDDGTYKLSETATPGGFNSIADIEFTITPAANGDLNDVNLGSATFTANDASGSLTGSIVNNQGIVLPSTGGIGTTIFYVVGALFIVGGIVLLISKKRMNIKEKE